MQNIYLNRYWVNRLPLEQAVSLTTPRLLAYYRKHIVKRSWFSLGCPRHLMQVNDVAYNGRFGTSASQQFIGYFDTLKREIDRREHLVVAE